MLWSCGWVTGGRAWWTRPFKRANPTCSFSVVVFFSTLGIGWCRVGAWDGASLHACLGLAVKLGSLVVIGKAVINLSLRLLRPRISTIRGLASRVLVWHCRQCVAILVTSCFGLACLDVSLDLLNISLAKHLRILDELETDLSSASPINESILVLSELWLQCTNLQIHLALVPRLVHLFCQQLLNSDATSQTIVVCV